MIDMCNYVFFVAVDSVSVFVLFWFLQMFLVFVFFLTLIKLVFIRMSPNNIILILLIQLLVIQEIAMIIFNKN